MKTKAGTDQYFTLSVNNMFIEEEHLYKTTIPNGYNCPLGIEHHINRVIIFLIQAFQSRHDSLEDCAFANKAISFYAYQLISLNHVELKNLFC